MDKVVSSRRVPLGDIVRIKQGNACVSALFSRHNIKGQFLGAYILSTLHEASKDPVENYGFSITYRSTHQDIRLTTYSMRNKPALPPPTINSILESSSGGDDPTTPTPTQQRQPSFPIPLLRRASSLRRGSGMLSQILSASAPPPSPGGNPEDELETVSFKALPVLDVHPDQIGVAPGTCRDAARRIVRDVLAGCRSVGTGHGGGFVVDEDIVRYVVSAWHLLCLLDVYGVGSLEEAQRITPVWAQLEYSFKRFLWLGS